MYCTGCFYKPYFNYYMKINCYCNIILKINAGVFSFTGIAITKNGEIYIADGTNIRFVDMNGIIHTLIGDYFHKSWRPIPCYVTLSLSQVLKMYNFKTFFLSRLN